MMKQGTAAIKELVVISGKGGTGKTTVTASFAALAQAHILADCDVDASNLELLTNPKIRTREDFIGGEKAVLDASRCAGCGRCARFCRFDAFASVTGTNGRHLYAIKEADCEGCGVCAEVCPRGAITMHTIIGGELFRSDTEFGPLVHARLKPGMGNSGKLATLVRNQAREFAKENGRKLLIVDGPPGVGCPTIASLTGATRALIVTEPTPSGIHDMERVIELCEHFRIPFDVCVNKADINQNQTAALRKTAQRLGSGLFAEIPNDPAVLECTRRGVPVVTTASPAAEAIRNLWTSLPFTA